MFWLCMRLLFLAHFLVCQPRFENVFAYYAFFQILFLRTTADIFNAAIVNILCVIALLHYDSFPLFVSSRGIGHHNPNNVDQNLGIVNHDGSGPIFDSDRERDERYPSRAATDSLTLHTLQDSLAAQTSEEAERSGYIREMFVKVVEDSEYTPIAPKSIVISKQRLLYHATRNCVTSAKLSVNALQLKPVDSDGATEESW